MNIIEQIEILKKQYQVIEVVDLNNWDNDIVKSRNWLEQTCQKLHKHQYANNERIIFTHSKDFYSDDVDAGIILRNLQIILNQVDISNFFVIVLSTNVDIIKEQEVLSNLSLDTVNVSVIKVDGQFTKHSVDHYSFKNETYRYGSLDPVKIALSDLSNRETFLLTKSKVFCIYPWIHLHAYPTGQAYPCCQARMKHPIGDCHKSTLKEIWNSDAQKKLRVDMLSETPNATCKSCYEQEESGFFSGRRSANKHHGHHINRIELTKDDGHVDEFSMTYWDIRFSNLCNLSCRSCGHIFSSSWYQDQSQLAGNEWKNKNKALNYAGRTKTDMWEQLIPHLDYVEQIYFAGGEPLMMEEHYNILDELERRGRFDVRLIYNTNFTHVKLKDRTVFDYWRKFKSVAVGASLDAMGPRAEYIRRGTKWDTVESNRKQMVEVCPDVDFYVSPTLSIMNALHLPDFHRSWVEQGLIKAQDLNINILQDPAHYRIDIAPQEYKNQIKKKYQEHLEWLKPQDRLQRATVGFESAINYMMSTDNTQLIDTFWRKTHELDNIRNENILEIIPELKALK